MAKKRVSQTPAPEIMNLVEAAEFLRVSQRKMWDLVHTGQVPAFRLGRAHRFSRDQLRRWMDARVMQANAAFLAAGIADHSRKES